MSTDGDLDRLREVLGAVDAGAGADPARLVAGAHRAAVRRRRRRIAGAGAAAFAAVAAALALPGLLPGSTLHPDLSVVATTPDRPETVPPTAAPARTAPPAVTGVRLGQVVDSPEGTGMCALSPGCPRVVFDVSGAVPGVYDLQCWVSRDGREEKFLDAVDAVEVTADGGHVDRSYCAVGPGLGVAVRIVLTDGPGGALASGWQPWTGEER